MKNLAVANVTQVAKEASLPPKSLIGQQLAAQRIGKRVNDFKADLQQKMHEKQTRGSNKKMRQPLEASRLPIPLKVHNATRRSLDPQEPNKPEKAPGSSTPKAAPRVNMVALNSGDTVPIVLSPTGFARFPRHSDDDDEWERLSQHSVPEAGNKEDTAQEPSGKKHFMGWFRK